MEGENAHQEEEESAQTAGRIILAEIESQRAIELAKIESEERTRLAEIQEQGKASLAQIEEASKAEIAQIIEGGRKFRHVAFYIAFLFCVGLIVWAYVNLQTPGWQTILTTLIAPSSVLWVLLRTWIRGWRKDRARIRKYEEQFDAKRSSSEGEDDLLTSRAIASADEQLKVIEKNAGESPEPVVRTSDVGENSHTSPEIKLKHGDK